jgi:CheY-like chemotaxis protein
MNGQNVRVMVASESPETRTVLRRIVETGDKAVIVGEAENGTRAMTLAHRLRPDVAIIDSHLPYVVGMDNIPLSRIAGLDIAQSISAEMPAMRVVLLNNLSEDILSRSAWRPEDNALLCREGKGICVPFTVGELSASAGSLIFANIEMQESEVPDQKVSLSDKLVFSGVIAGVAGWLMILTMFLAMVGIFVVGAGVLTAAVGLVGKLASQKR